MLNHIVLMGRLTADPELRQTASGTSCVSFTLAVDRDYKPEGGERETDFIPCVAWRSTADFIAKYFSKGRAAVVSGRLQVRKWQNKEGENRYSTEVLAENVYFGDSKKEEPSGGYSAPAYPTDPNQGFEPASDDDLPF
jgi:single-strand DNA-binding protein